MTVKRILLFTPAILIIFLLQSYLWVPTYEEQTKGNPQRLNEYIAASIGDASILNPVLSSDSASSQIEALVFEGLLDRDEDLRFRGRLAASWEIFEEAFFYVNNLAKVPSLGKTDASEIKKLILAAKGKRAALDPELKASLDNIKEISILPLREFSETIEVYDPDQTDKKTEVKINARSPARIRLTLKEVDQELFDHLTKILGDKYFSDFNSAQYISTTPVINEEIRAVVAKKILPPVEHNPILIFHLRPHVRFHDGHVFDAGDVKFTYEAIMNPKNLSPRAADYEPVKAVEVIDPLCVRIVYKRLYSPAIGTWAMGILPEHLLNDDNLKSEAKGLGKDPESYSIRQSRLNRHPIGCGPFVFHEWKSDQYISLVRFADYWEGPPNYERYVFRIVPDLLTQEMEFYAGTIDEYGVRPHQVNRLRHDPQYQSFEGLSFGYNYIGYNLRRKPFDDPRVRRALGMAIDVDRIIEYVLYDQGERITGPFVKQTDFYNQNVQPVPYDPAGALKILESVGWKRNEAGWLEKDGKRFQFTLITNNGNPLREEILAIAQNAWKKIGIDVRTDRVEWSVFIQERVNKLDFDALILGWSMGIDPDLYQIWHSSQTNPHQLNFVGFKNSEADDLIVKIRQEYDHRKMVQYCHRLHEIIAEEQPYTFLNVGKWTAILDKRIVIKKTDEDGTVRYEKIRPTKTGNYSFHFNRWIKLPQAPVFSPEG